ncbi:MAG: EAL domain-containing protein [Rhodospirillaceae bacterium]|jgi:diguanylate cyclase (GGDEF)-like protein/PAS domain S-box-containing protein|nr:EAL domain-containing protein [Rhodospirillaceae bacterium]
MNMTARAKIPANDISVPAVDGLVTELLEAVPYMVCLCAGGRLGYINPAGLRLLGLDSPQQAAGKSFSDFVDADYADILAEELSSHPIEDLDLPVKIISAKGNVVDVATTIRPFKDGNTPGSASCIIMGLDITERISTARDLRRARDELAELVMERTEALVAETGTRQQAEADLGLAAQVLSSLNDAVIIMGADRCVRTVNAACERITGLTSDEMVGCAPPFISPLQNDGNLEAMWARVENEGHWTGEYWTRRKDGVAYAERLSISRITDETGDIHQFAAVLSDVTRRKKDEEKIRYQASYDTLTGLPNRELFMDRLGQAIASTRRLHHKMGLIFIDLDGFKMVNDSLGHDIGDLLLKEAAIRLERSIRDTDTVARLGGDEFTVIMPNLEDPRLIQVVAQRILDTLADTFVLAGQECFISGSLGITVFPDDAKTVSDLLKNADTAMYLAKEEGKANYQFYTEKLNQDVIERVNIKNGLVKALDRNELELYYQPKLDMTTDRVTGVEALMRWSNDTMGPVSPARFIPIMEETGQVVEVGAWALREAMTRQVEWQKLGFPLRVAVNLSARQLREPSFVQMIEDILEETGIGPEVLELEVTESMLISGTEDAVVSLARLHDMGIHVAMDDFGTGYSSLSYLKKFPIDTIKIDQSFVADIATDSDDAEIIRTIIGMGRILGREVVAEGVETREQFELLRDYQCNQIQGYYLSRPLPGPELAAFMESRV